MLLSISIDISSVAIVLLLCLAVGPAVLMDLYQSTDVRVAMEFNRMWQVFWLFNWQHGRNWQDRDNWRDRGNCRDRNNRPDRSK